MVLLSRGAHRVLSVRTHLLPGKDPRKVSPGFSQHCRGQGFVKNLRKAGGEESSHFTFGFRVTASIGDLLAE
jgi:hypothetical protein